MPAATATSARARTRTRRRADPVGRVRWDRLARLALLAVLVALVYLYMSAGVRMFSTWRQSRHDNASVATLTSEHARLARQHVELSGQAALEAQARKLGMMRRNEQPYVVSELPDN